jgi:Leucine-rich repeat (LRR) protein
MSASAGNDIMFDEELCNNGKAFANKIWNAFRLVKGWEVQEIEQPLHSKMAVIYYKNKFDSLPAVVYEITSLKKLTFSRNQIERIDEKIGQLSELRYLDFWDNPIGVFPEAFLNLKKLKVVHAEGIRFGPKFQAYWSEIIPNVKIYFDAPCDCKE